MKKSVILLTLAGIIAFNGLSINDVNAKGHGKAATALFGKDTKIFTEKSKQLNEIVDLIRNKLDKQSREIMKLATDPSVYDATTPISSAVYTAAILANIVSTLDVISKELKIEQNSLQHFHDAEKTSGQNALKGRQRLRLTNDIGRIFDSLFETIKADIVQLGKICKQNSDKRMPRSDQIAKIIDEIENNDWKKIHHNDLNRAVNSAIGNGCEYRREVENFSKSASDSEIRELCSAKLNSIDAINKILTACCYLLGHAKNYAKTGNASSLIKFCEYYEKKTGEHGE